MFLSSEQRNGVSLPTRTTDHSPVRSQSARRPRSSISRYGNSSRWGDRSDHTHADRGRQANGESGRSIRHAEDRSPVSASSDAPDLALPTPPQDRFPYNNGGPARFHRLGSNSNGDYGSSGRDDEDGYDTRSRPPGAPPTSRRSDTNLTARSSKSKLKHGVSSSAAELRNHLSRDGVDLGLAGVGDSLRLSTNSSLWAMPPPPPPAGHAVPALLSHVAELRSLCQRQRESGRSLRGALVRKQGELDEISTEASWLRAELGFIVGDMLGALQENPSAGTIFGALAERIRGDLGAEAAAVYIDIGDGTLWLLPQGENNGQDSNGVGGAGEDVFVRRGVGVVGLVALGAVPTSTGSQQQQQQRMGSDGQRTSSSDGGGGDGVEILLLNHGFEAFDNGTTVEAALIRAARGMPEAEEGGSAMGRGNAISGTVRNMLLARVGPALPASSAVGASAAESMNRLDANFPSYLPGAPTAVIQALNKQVAPERFTEGDARAVRSLAPAVAAGSRLILTLLNCARGRTNVGDNSLRGPAQYSEERLLREGLRRARELLGADRARIFLLNAEASPGQLRVWHEDPPPFRTQRLAGSSSFWRGFQRGISSADTDVRMAADSGLEGLALATGRPVRSVDALSDPRYNRELDLQASFLTRSVLCAPLFLRSRDSHNGDDRKAIDGSDESTAGAAVGVLQLAIGRGQEADKDNVAGGVASSIGSTASRRRGDQRKKFFVEDDEGVIETFADQIADLLSTLLDNGLLPRASITTLAGGAGDVGAAGWVKTSSRVSDSRAHDNEKACFEERAAGRVAEAGADQPEAAQRLAMNVAASAYQPTSNPLPLRVAPLMRSTQPQNVDDDGRSGRANGVEADGFPPRRRQSREQMSLAQETAAQESPARRALASSGASTVQLSPQGAALRASIATAPAMSPAESPPPPSPATDGTDSVSPRGQKVADELRSVALDGETPRLTVEEIQANSWAIAQRVVEACKEGLAADRRISKLRGMMNCARSGGRNGGGKHESMDVLLSSLSAKSISNAERLAPAACSLVSSLLPGCSVVLLLLESGSGRLRHVDIDCNWETSSILPGSPRSPHSRAIRREDVAQRAMASGKALLAHAGEKRDRESIASTPGGQGATGNVSPRGAGGDRVFCVPLVGPAGKPFGVLQLFLPPPPVGGAASPLPGRSEQRHAALPLPPPPPSFFMATKIISDCFGLALGWCEVVDQEEADREAERRAAAIAFAAAEKSTTEVHLQNQRELSANYERDAQDKAESVAADVANIANEHALTVARLLEGREALAAAAAETADRARRRRYAARALAAWRETTDSLQKSERNIHRMARSRIAAAFHSWRKRLSMRDIERRSVSRGAAAAGKRGSRRALTFWAREAARAQASEERRLMGMRLLGQIWRKTGTTRQCFDSWRSTIRDLVRAREASALNDAASAARDLLLAKEETLLYAARAQALAERVADISERRRRDRVMRSACQAWAKKARQRRRSRHAMAGSVLWRRRRDLFSALTRWRNALAHGIPSIMTGTPPAPPEDKQQIDVTRKNIIPTRRLSKAGPSPQRYIGGTVLTISVPSRSDSIAESTTRRFRDIATGIKRGGRVEATDEDNDDASSLRTRLHETEARLSHLMEVQRNRRTAVLLLSSWRRQTAIQRDRRAALSRVLRNLLQRRPLARALSAWGLSAATPPVSNEAERNKAVIAEARTRAILRLVGKSRHWMRDRGFRKWRRAAAAATSAADHEASLREAVKAKRKRAAAAAASAAAVKSAIRARGDELKRAKDAAADLQNTVDVLREEVAASVAREQGKDIRLQQKRERASVLSMAAARSFRDGRDRVKVAQAIATLRSVARSRRLVAASIARISSLGRFRCLQAWNARAQRLKHYRASSATAVSFAVESSKHALAEGARGVLREWAAKTTRRRRRQHGTALISEKIRRSGLLVGVRAWTDMCRRRAAAITVERRRAAQLERSNARRALQNWRLAAFGIVGVGGARTTISDGGGGGGRVLARLFGVAVGFDEATRRRRVRTVLRGWLGRVEKRKGSREAGMRCERAVRRTKETTALHRWRSLSLIRQSLHRSLECGATHAALRELCRGLMMWRRRAQMTAKRRKALQQSNSATTAKTAVTVTATQNVPFTQDCGGSGGGGGGGTHEASSRPDNTALQTRHNPPQLPPQEVHTATPGPCGESRVSATQRGVQNTAGSTPPVVAKPHDRATQSKAEPTECTARAERSQSVSSSSGLLDILVETCAAPPSYTLGSGLGMVGREACSAAVRTFGLLSASLFEVTGGPQATVKCMAVVRKRSQRHHLADSAISAEESKYFEGSAVLQEDLANGEPLGQSAVGVAARSARPVCIEVETSSEEREGLRWGDNSVLQSARPFTKGSGSRIDARVVEVAGASMSTILCVPVMVQTAPLQAAPEAGLERLGGSTSIIGGSVEVVGVLRAVRSGSCAFAGDDARALSAFCGQLALAVMAEHVLSDVRAAAAADTMKEARKLRRQVCQKITGLFAGGALAEALLYGRHNEDVARTAASAGAASTSQMPNVALDPRLWGSVAGRAAEALGCESVDLVRVASVTPGALSDRGGRSGVRTARLAHLLSRRSAASRSFRRRSSLGAATTQTSGVSGTASTSNNGSKGREQNDEGGTSLCAPVLGTGAGADAGRAAGAEGHEEEGMQSDVESTLVCCAVNKGRGRSFDDVDEALLETIAALYGIASSWMKRPSLPVEGAAIRLSQRRHSRDAGTITENSHLRVNELGSVAQPEGSESSPTLREATTVGDARATQGANLNKSKTVSAHASLRLIGANSTPPLRDAATSPILQARPGDVRHERKGNSLYDLLPERWRNDCERGGTAAHQPGNAHRPRSAPSYFSVESREEEKPSPYDTAVSNAMIAKEQENAVLRGRADRAERMLAATRERLCRALEDGASAAAAAVAASGGNADGTMAPENKGDARAHSYVYDRKPRGRSTKKVPSDLSETDIRTSRRSHHRRRSATTGPKFRTRRSRDGEGVEPENRQHHFFETESSELHSHVGGYYSSDGGVERRRGAAGRSRPGLALPEAETSRERRRPSSAAGPRKHRRRQRNVDDGDSTTGARRAGEEQGGEAELRSSDIKRMREVVARLRIATAQLEAERARRYPRHATQHAQREGQGQRGEGRVSPGDVLRSGGIGTDAGFQGRSAHGAAETMWPLSNQTWYSRGGGDGRVATAVGRTGTAREERCIAEVEASGLIRENASLRRKLNGLVALEKLEGRAIEKGLLPLTGGGIMPEGELFPLPRER